MDAKLSAAKLAKQVGVSSRNVEVNIKKLKERGILIRCGSPKSGHWKIIIENLSCGSTAQRDQKSGGFK